ncbi:MAG: hypothetical protein Q9168_007602 [Polycauliona sp. 1 TL-2023]
MVIGVVGLDLLLRASVIEKSTADRWDDSGPLIDPNVNGRPHTSVKAPPDVEVTADGQVPIGNRQQARRLPSSEPGAYSWLLPTAIGQDIHHHADIMFGSQPPPDPRSSDSWFIRHFPSTTAMVTSKRLMAAVFGIFVHMTITTAFDGILAQFVKKTFGFDSFGVGVIYLAITIPSMFGTIFGALSDRYGPRIVALAGFVTTTLGLALLVLITRKTEAQLAGLFILLAVVGERSDIKPTAGQTAKSVV